LSQLKISSGSTRPTDQMVHAVLEEAEGRLHFGEDQAHEGVLDAVLVLAFEVVVEVQFAEESDELRDRRIPHLTGAGVRRRA
jgi:hypothetical protein